MIEINRPLPSHACPATLMARTVAPAVAGILAIAASPASVMAASVTPQIQHVVIIMQENRSFDHYFGTFPGANGIPGGTCIPDNVKTPSFCVAPFHDPFDINAGGPHASTTVIADIDGGKMNGFVQQQIRGGAGLNCVPATSEQCIRQAAGLMAHDAMGYHTAAEIPSYWAYARNFVLQDSMFEPVASFSMPAHLYLTSEWSARCSSTDPTSCWSQLVPPFGYRVGKSLTLPWTDLSYLLDRAGVSWKYYLSEGTEPDCSGGEMTCPPVTQLTTVSSLWNPMPSYGWVQQANAADPTYVGRHVVQTDQFLKDIAAGALPTVSWIVPTEDYSEHPPSRVQTGMVYVTSLINAIMETASPTWKGTNYWANTVIILAWDDWGGFYDHVQPPKIDSMPNGATLGYGLRVPSIIIGPYVKAGTIDHQVLSFDSYNRFIEDLFLSGARLDPASDGRPDSRPDVREAIASVVGPAGNQLPVGDLMNDFDFQQSPLPPLPLPIDIPLNVLAAIDAPSGGARITWQPVKIAPVAGYNVKRSTSIEGPFVTLPGCAGLSAAVSSCIDPTVPPAGTVFSYVVSAVAPDGAESPNSVVVQVP